MPRPVPFRGIRYRCFHCEHPAIDEEICWNCGLDPMSPQSREEIRRRIERARRQSEADDAAMRAFVQQRQTRRSAGTSTGTWSVNWFEPTPEPPIHDPLSTPPIPNPDRVVPLTEEQRRLAEDAERNTRELTREQFIDISDALTRDLLDRAEVEPPPPPQPLDTEDEEDDDDDYQYMPDDDDEDDDE